MGQYRVEIEAVGNHGCRREVKDGEQTYGCGLISCPDCATREFVRQLTARGNSVSKAKLTHWPGQVGEVIDNLLTGERTGNF